MIAILLHSYHISWISQRGRDTREAPWEELEAQRINKIANTLCSGPPQGALTTEANTLIV